MHPRGHRGSRRRGCPSARPAAASATSSSRTRRRSLQEARQMLAPPRVELPGVDAGRAPNGHRHHAVVAVVERELDRHGVGVAVDVVDVGRRAAVWTCVRSAKPRPFCVEPAHLLRRPTSQCSSCVTLLRPSRSRRTSRRRVGDSWSRPGGIAERPSARASRPSGCRRTATDRSCSRRRSDRARTSGCTRPRSPRCGSTIVSSMLPDFDGRLRHRARVASACCAAQARPFARA